MVLLDDDTQRGGDVGARLIEAHEADRTRIASELHDDIGQRMAVLTMNLDALEKALPLSTSEARTRIRELSDQTLQLARDIQALSHRLHPPKLDYLGLASASAAFCREVSTRRNVDIVFSHDGIPDGLPGDVALALFRVIQEAVTNAVTHAGVGRVVVTLRGIANEIRLEIVDAGVGFDVDAVLSGRGVGLVGMRERMRLVSGDLDVESRPGAGTSIRARVPLSGADSSPAAT
jgi:signal transduction histidine kinase